MFLPNNSFQSRINEGLNEAVPRQSIFTLPSLYFLYCLFSWDATKASWEALNYQDIPQKLVTSNKRRKATKQEKFYYNGRRDEGRIRTAKNRVGHNQLFIFSEKRFLFRNKYSASKIDSSLSNNSPNSKQLLAFKNLVEFCLKHNIDLKLYISPIHARQLKVIDTSGAWTMFENWKRALVNIVHKQTALESKKITLWDFSGYNEYTTEPLPEAKDVRADMKWYWEGSHFKVALGNKILDMVLSKNSLTDQSADGFGTIISMANIEHHLAIIKGQRDNYQRRHVKKLRDIEVIYSLSQKRSNRPHN